MFEKWCGGFWKRNIKQSVCSVFLLRFREYDLHACLLYASSMQAALGEVLFLGGRAYMTRVVDMMTTHNHKRKAARARYKERLGQHSGDLCMPFKKILKVCHGIILG